MDKRDIEIPDERRKFFENNCNIQLFKEKTPTPTLALYKTGVLKSFCKIHRNATVVESFYFLILY